MEQKYDYDLKKTGSDIYLIPKNTDYNSVLIFLHGFGTNAEDLLDIFYNPKNNNYIVPFSTKIILLGAPQMPITLYKGRIATAWFDISKEGHNFNDVEKNSARIFKIIKNETKKLNNDSSKILIGGFSQGAMMSLYVGYSLPIKLGGVIVCSGKLFKEIEILKENENLKVFVGHGKSDNVISLEKNIESFKRVKYLEKNIEFHFYENMKHEITVNELLDIKKFIFNITGNK